MGITSMALETEFTICWKLNTLGLFQYGFSNYANYISREIWDRQRRKVVLHLYMGVNAQELSLVFYFAAT
jgi:hypothetical protein